MSILESEQHLMAQLQVRKKTEVCTDPQRRCYNGAFASSEMQWTDWETLLTTHQRCSEDDLRSSMSAFKTTNPDHEYRIVSNEEVITVSHEGVS